MKVSYKTKPFHTTGQSCGGCRMHAILVRELEEHPVIWKIFCCSICYSLFYVSIEQKKKGESL